MVAIVLESWLGSQYEDAPDSYEFQSRYLRFFEPLRRGETVHAVIYEPRGDRGGRMAYVALAEVVGSPVTTGRKNRAGEDLWRVHYRQPAESFERIVPREILGVPIEGWLAARPRGRSRNVATLGRAVRTLADGDFERILRLASAAPLGELQYPTREDHVDPLVAARERVERVVSLYERRASFRREVLQAYAFRCCVTGLGLGGVIASKSHGVLDAAHIRPVGANGMDTISNGLALTPTLHRLFDQGLFTTQYVDGDLRVLTSPRLRPEMVEAPERNVSLQLRDGVRLALPTSVGDRPSGEQLLFHQRRIFLAS